MMTLHPTLGVPPKIAAGLAAGRLTLWGGTVRVSSDHAGAGTIVALLKDGADSKLPAIAEYLPGITAGASIATLGVCALGFAVMNAKLSEIKRELGAIKAVLQNIGDDLDHVIVANLEAANELLKKSQRAIASSRATFLPRAVDRYVEAASVYRQRFDSTPDTARDLLDQYLKALGVALAGELACHYLREDWREMRQSADEAAAMFRPRASRLISLSLGCGPDYAAWRGNPSGSPAAALYLHPALSTQLPFKNLLWLHQTIAPDQTAESLVELLRRPMSLAFRGTENVNFGETLGITRLEGRNYRGGFWTNLMERADFSDVAEAVLASARNGSVMLRALESYSEQYKILEEGAMTPAKLELAFSGETQDKSGLLVIDANLLAA